MVIRVVELVQALRDELMRVQVQRLEKRLLQRDRRAQVAIVLELVLFVDHLDAAAPLRGARRHGAQLDQDRAHARS